MKILKRFFIVLICVTLLTEFHNVVHADSCECGKNSSTIISKYDDGILYDIYGSPVVFDKLPARVVSLVPAVTEMIEAVNPGYKLSGVTTHDSESNIAHKAKIVGGFYRPDVKIIKALDPDIIFAASLHEAIHDEFEDSNTFVIVLEAHGADDIYRNIEIVGKMFHNEKKAKEIISGIKAKIENLQKKLAMVPKEKRVRVMRLMGFDGKVLGTPGDDSFQTEAIKLAGGIPIKTGRDGQITYINVTEWNKFNPHAVYSCGNSKMWNVLKKDKSWGNGDAVKNNRHFIFPCNLTCRASVNYGAFIESLSAALYGKHFFSSPPVKKDGSFYEKKIDIDIPYIKSASVKYGTIDDFEHKTLVLKLNKKMEVLSTLTGLKNVDTTGNHYLSPPRWSDSHSVTVDALEKKICNAVNANPASSAFLITGADMDNLAVIRKEYRKLTVYALVTAGVKGNAQRQSADEGLYYPHGTINMIILSNTHLSQAVMARVLITATEAKTAAIQDMDIRSTYTGLANQATGTGTDNIIVISGEGVPVESAGGHTKAGELIARASYEAVIKTVRMQNGIRSARSVHRRLEERNISIAQIASFAFVGASSKPAPANKQFADSERSAILIAQIEKIFLDPEIAGFIEIACAVSDARSKNLVSNDSLFNKWCLEIAGKIAGKNINKLIPVNIGENKYSPLNMALSAILTGAVKTIN
ncbi:MAG: adenosylcobinamide amidohydrolase [Spirochaetes bacterium]|nr:adenosylcobinamide amidohydrolase [Spirochaetota bacterium]